MRIENTKLGDIEVDAVQSPYVAEGLDQTFGIDGAWHVSLHVVGDSSESLDLCGSLRPADDGASGCETHHNAMYRVPQRIFPIG